jgi:hypothetical protein
MFTVIAFRDTGLKPSQEVGESPPKMTVSELIEELSAMPANATVMVWSRMDDPQHRSIESVELSTAKSDPSAEIVVLS